LVEPVKDITTSEIATDITETPIQHARKRALSGQQIQAEKLMRTTKRKLSELSVGNNVIIPIPQNFKNLRSGLSELQVQRWLQNFKMQVQKKISCVFHVVMVL
jgi:hypothetical protein